MAAAPGGAAGGVLVALEAAVDHEWVVHHGPLDHQPIGATTTTSAAGVACAASSLAIGVVGSQGAAGTFELTFALRNTSGTSCPMKGFPGAQLLSASGAQLTDPRRPRDGAHLHRLRPRPGGAERGGRPPTSTWRTPTCPRRESRRARRASQIEITPPGASDHGLVTVQMQVCGAGTLTVSPVFASSSPETQTTAPPLG